VGEKEESGRSKQGGIPNESHSCSAHERSSPQTVIRAGKAALGAAEDGEDSVVSNG